MTDSTQKPGLAKTPDGEVTCLILDFLREKPGTERNLHMWMRRERIMEIYGAALVDQVIEALERREIIRPTYGDDMDRIIGWYAYPDLDGFAARYDLDAPLVF